MNINPIDFSYIDGKNTYPIIDYIDENLEITSNVLTSEIDYTSNILNTKINYINTNNINYTNALRTDISKLIEEVDGDPNILTTAVFAAISDGKCRVNLHTDVDTEFIIHERPGKLFKRKIRQYRAHIAIEIPNDCYFYYVDSNKSNK